MSAHITLTQVAILAMEAEEENLSEEKRLSLGQEVFAHFKFFSFFDIFFLARNILLVSKF